MKRILRQIVIFTSAVLLSIASIADRATAQNHRFQNLDSDLIYPKSSERFFRTGHQQLELEIQQLQQGHSPQKADILKINSSIDPQLNNLEHQPLGNVQTSQKRILPID